MEAEAHSPVAVSPKDAQAAGAELEPEVSKDGVPDHVAQVAADTGTDVTTVEAGEPMVIENGMEIDDDVDPETEQVSPPTDEVAATKEEEGLSAEEIKYWSAVKENPSDFTSWTMLLQLIDHKGKVDPAREVFNAFLQLYPYCYGYWKKYADFEKKHSGPDAAIEVFERGVLAIPLSVDLWLHYAGFMQTQQKAEKEKEGTEGEGEEGKEDSNATLTKTKIRSFYARAVEGCGMEYRSGKIWDSYLKWEQANGTPRDVLAVYDQLLLIPTQDHQQYFDNCKQLIESTPPSELLTQQEYEELSGAMGRVSEQTSQTEDGEGGKEGKDEVEDKDAAIREKALQKRAGFHEICKVEVEKRVQFENGIKRPYFHVKPLERAQLKNWKDYLDFEISEGDQRRIIVLFERCMIASALYEDFWSKFAKYVEGTYQEYAGYVYSRACTIHLQQKPNIHLAWATFEEKRGNVDTARGILRNIDSVVPGLVFIRLWRIALEVRDKSYDRADALYLESVSGAQSNEARNFYAGRYARFAARVLGDHDKAARILEEAIEKDKLNPTLYLRLLDVEMSRSPVSEAAMEALFELVRSNELPEDNQMTFALRKVQVLEEMGATLTKLLEAQAECEKLKAIAGKKRTSPDEESEPSKKARLDSASQGSDAATAPTTSATMEQQVDAQSQQWAAYQQQQWGAYNYGQQGYNYQQYYQYPYQQQPTQ